ncbi:MAG: hypothetical protein BalsKO_07360 [Balneolaceae bacterium]
MSTILLHNIGDKNWGFNFRLTKSYFLAKINSIALDFLQGELNKLIDKTVFRTEEFRVLLEEVYKEAKNAPSDESKEVISIIITVRKSITKQNKRFSTINYAERKDLKDSFLDLVRLVNRLEARLNSNIYSDIDINKTPDYIKDKMALNSKKAVTNALLQEANC